MKSNFWILWGKVRQLRSVIAVCLLFNASMLVSAEDQQDNHDPEHHHKHGNAEVEHRPGENVRVYSCNLISYSNQCREYVIADEEIEKTRPLKGGCESMGGTFQQADCPVQSRLSRCANNMYNEHDPDTVIYSNHYYPGEIGDWTDENVQRVCDGLGGRFMAH